MSIFKRAALAAMAAAFVSTAAQAVPYTIVDYAGTANSLIQSAYTVKLRGGQTLNIPAQSYSYTHNILDAGYTAGDAISSAVLSIVLRDGNNANGVPNNQDPENGVETPRIEFNVSGVLMAFGTSNIGDNDTFEFDLSTGTFANLAAIGRLESDGLLTITLHALQQSNGQQSGYFFGSSELTVTADDGTVPPVPTPEPGALALLGLGTLGIGLARRRKA